MTPGFIAMIYGTKSENDHFFAFSTGTGTKSPIEEKNSKIGFLSVFVPA
jgi:hypothetical protein